jgi:hypothetical protein
MAWHRFTYPRVSEVSARDSRHAVERLLAERAARMAVSPVRQPEHEAPAAARRPGSITRSASQGSEAVRHGEAWPLPDSVSNGQWGMRRARR